MEKLLQAQDVARMARWHLVTVYKKAAAGEIPGRVKLGSGSLRFKKSEVEEWLRGVKDANAESSR
jgi:excisionase family DNA binding protein